MDEDKRTEAPRCPKCSGYLDDCLDSPNAWRVCECPPSATPETCEIAERCLMCGHYVYLHNSDPETHECRMCDLLTERDSLRAELQQIRDAKGTPLAISDALWQFAEKECGHNPASAQHPIQSIQEHVATLRAERDTINHDADRWRRAHDGVLASAARMVEEIRAELAAAVARADRFELALYRLRDGVNDKCEPVPQSSSWRQIIDQALEPVSAPPSTNGVCACPVENGLDKPDLGDCPVCGKRIPGGELTPHEKMAELVDAGWRKRGNSTWLFPWGAFFRGPHQAWTVKRAVDANPSLISWVGDATTDRKEER